MRHKSEAMKNKRLSHGTTGNYSYLIGMSDEDVLALDQEVIAVKKHNQKAYAFNRVLNESIADDIVSFLKEAGVVTTKARGGYYAHVKKCIDEASVYMTFPVTDIKFSHNRFINHNGEKIELNLNNVNTYVGIKAVIDRVLENQNKLNKEYQEAAEYLLYNGHASLINVHDAKETIRKATDIAKDAFYDENVKDGDIVDISCCSECDTYVQGERRCSCGNRRIDTLVEGKIGNFYIIHEAY